VTSSKRVHPLSAIYPQGAGPAVEESFHPDPHVPGETDRTGSEPSSVDTPRMRSLWLKLAVLLVVAALCIAFAGLVWALIF